eukprot:IDg19225t1
MELIVAQRPRELAYSRVRKILSHIGENGIYRTCRDENDIELQLATNLGPILAHGFCSWTDIVPLDSPLADSARSFLDMSIPQNTR